MAESWLVPSYRTMCSPSRFGKPFGQYVGGNRHEEELDLASFTVLGGFHGPSGSHLEQLQPPLGKPSVALWASLAVLGLGPSDAVGSRLGGLSEPNLALLGRLRAVLEAILGVLVASRAALGGLLGTFLGAS